MLGPKPLTRRAGARTSAMNTTLHGGRGETLAAGLREFALILTQEHDADTILAELGRVSTRILGVDGVGVLLREPSTGGLAVATANTARGRIVEELEAELLEGPCTDTMATAEQMIVPDLEKAVERYPKFAPLALEAGVRSI